MSLGNWLRGHSVRTRMTASVVTSAGFLLAVGASGLAGMQRVADAQAQQARDASSSVAVASRQVAQRGGEAVAQRDQRTPHDAAPVEPSTAAAESLNAQAERLADVVSNFRLEPRPA
jgi:methyl-accepting chemotaxis protein